MGFTMPHVLILAGAGVAGLALILQIVGLATPHWIVAVSPLSGNKGLWKICDYTGECAELSKLPPFTVPDYVWACRAFGILAVLAIAACLGLVALICVMSEQKIFGLLAPLAAAAGAVCCLIEFAVYAGEDELSKLEVNFELEVKYGYSFALTIVAMILCVIAAVLLFLGKQRAAA